MKTFALVSMIAMALSGIGCAAGRAPFMAPTDAAMAGQPVDVLLDTQPERPFKVVSELQASAIEMPRAVEMMREEAAKQGLDGIYWIDCPSACSGHCSAKGFVYTRPESPAAGSAPVTTLDVTTVSMR